MKKLLERYWPKGDPVTLIDVGASGFTHAPFEVLKGFSRTIEFDPDSRDFSRASDDGSIMIPKAVTSEPEAKSVTIYLTQEPHCSSTLPPNPTKAKDWVYGKAFELESEVEVPATTIDTALAENELDVLHWLKLDTQGTDGRIIESLSKSLLNGLLVCEVEPGYCDHYIGADTFGAIHSYLTANGFFMADMKNQTQVRMRVDVHKELISGFSPVVAKFVKKSLRSCPTAPEVLYLRSISSATELNYSEEQWVQLWVLAIAANQLEYGYDVATEIHRRFDKVNGELVSVSKELLKKRALSESFGAVVSYLKAKICKS